MIKINNHSIKCYWLCCERLANWHAESKMIKHAIKLQCFDMTYVLFV